MTISDDPRVRDLQGRKNVAVQSLLSAEDEQIRAEQVRDQAREAFIESKALHSIGDATDEELRAAQARFEDSQAALDASMLDAEAARHAIGLLDERRRELMEDLKADLAGELEREASAAAEELREAIRAFLAANDRMLAIDRRRTSNGIDSSASFDRWNHYVRKSLRASGAGYHRVESQLQTFLQTETEEVAT